MKTAFITLMICSTLILFSGCKHLFHPKGSPPGQVKKATGYNPASGKVNTSTPSANKKSKGKNK